jgi:hypothetical protein
MRQKVKPKTNTDNSWRRNYVWISCPRILRGRNLTCSQPPSLPKDAIIYFSAHSSLAAFFYAIKENVSN